MMLAKYSVTNLVLTKCEICSQSSLLFLSYDAEKKQAGDYTAEHHGVAAKLTVCR